MFKFLSIFLIFLSLQLSYTKEISKSISLYIENDYCLSDRYYTNALKLLYTQEGEDFYTSKLQFMFLDLIADDDRQSYQTISLGQDMYVPSEISQKNPPQWDRPYAGWLYVSFGSHRVNKDTLDSFTINLGVVGPYSLAEDTQTFWHNLIGDDEPMGWDTQINNEPGIIISYAHSQRLLTHNISSNFATDFIATAGADLGNVRTGAQIKGLWRFGFNMPDSFEAVRIDNANASEISFQDEYERTPSWSVYGYTGLIGYLVGYDITLDGNTFEDSRSVNKEYFVGEWVSGISARYQEFEIALNYTLRSAEYDTQIYPHHSFWTLRLKVNW